MVASIRVASLHTYPVKGLRGIDLGSAQVERQGLQHDRRWALLRPEGDARAGTVFTQRDLPGMARIDAAPTATGLRLDCAGYGGIDAVADGPAVTLTVWGTRVPAIAASPATSAWLARVLGANCTLAYLADPAARAVTPALANPGDVVSLADGFPLLVTSMASLEAVNARMAAPLPMARFRPNLVLEGAPAWAEDLWSHIDLPGLRLRLVSPCARCTVTTLDQRTGASTPRKEPLRTLGLMHRGDDGSIEFGWNAIPDGLGTIHVGDAVQPGLRPGLRPGPTGLHS